MKKTKIIFIWSILILSFINIFADTLPKQSFKGQLVIVQELKINNDTVRLGVSSEGQLLRYDGTKYTNWTPDFDSLNAGLLDGKHQSDFLKYTDPVIESDTIKARADIIVTGEIYDEINHLYGMVYDSTITLSLTQNVWQQVTNPTKTLYLMSEQNGITISADTIVFSKAGGYDVYFEINGTGINSKDYHYRILQKNGTTTVRSYNKYASTGTKVLRNERAYVHVNAGSKVWCEIMSPSSAPGSITINGAKIYVMQRYLEK